MKFKKLAAIVLSTAALTACGSVQDQAKVPEAKDKWEAPQGLSGDLTFYSANPQGLTDDLVQAFKEKTHVNVNVFSGETGKITARLEAEKANPKADLVYLASENAAKKQARTDAYEEFTLEGADKIHEGWAKGKYTGRDGSALALVVSTKATDQHLADWEDLTKPEFKDKVIMPDPRESGTAADLVSAMVEKFGEQKTWDLFSRLFANGMVVQGGQRSRAGCGDLRLQGRGPGRRGLLRVRRQGQGRAAGGGDALLRHQRHPAPSDDPQDRQEQGCGRGLHQLHVLPGGPGHRREALHDPGPHRCEARRGQAAR